ncbi:MAG: exo-alpha-sialidase [Gemmatimonadota bacterium]|nr:exo-alpha-sialidase [Gemmatimonadota bacterium]
MTCSFKTLLAFTAGLSLVLAAGSQAEEQPLYRESFVFEGTALIPECYRPSLVCLPDGALACAWATGSGPRALDTSIKLSFQPAGESQWTEAHTIADDIGYPDNYPVLAGLPEGTLRLLYATLYREKRKAPPGADLASWHMKYRDSADGGRIWGPDYFLVPESERVPCSSVVNLANGGLILPVTDIQNCSSLFLMSEDKGAYWKDLSRITDPAALVDPAVAELEPGRLVAMLRPHENSELERFLWRTESNDNGRTWSEPRKTELKNPGGPAELLKLANGHLVLAWNDHALWLTPLTLAVSEDGGKTWPSRRNLETGKWDIREPGLIQTKDGHIHVVYVSRNIHVKHIEVTESWITENRGIKK